MSQRKKLEQVLEFLINEETERAEELLHDIVVGKARTIYESLVNDEEEEIEEDFGGDEKEDFIGEIEANKDEIEGDEIADGEAADFGDAEDDLGDELGLEDDGLDLGDDKADMSTEERVEDLEAQLAELEAQFQELVDTEESEEGHEFSFTDGEEGEELDLGGEEGEELDFGSEEEGFGDEEEEFIESLAEATKLQDPVPDPGMKSETGKLTGTGKNSKTGATGKESPYTKAPTKTLNGSKPTDWTKGGDEKGGKGDSAKECTPSDNIDEEPKNFSHKEQKSEGDFVGTGKQSKKGATNSKSPLSNAPRRP